MFIVYKYKYKEGSDSQRENDGQNKIIPLSYCKKDFINNTEQQKSIKSKNIIDDAEFIQLTNDNKQLFMVHTTKKIHDGRDEFIQPITHINKTFYINKLIEKKHISKIEYNILTELDMSQAHKFNYVYDNEIHLGYFTLNENDEPLQERNDEPLQDRNDCENDVNKIKNYKFISERQYKLLQEKGMERSYIQNVNERIYIYDNPLLKQERNDCENDVNQIMEYKFISQRQYKLLKDQGIEKLYRQEGCN